MNLTSNIFLLEGVVQEYNWGGKRFLPEFLGVNNKGNKPHAEYWMGAHVNAPSMVVMDGGQKLALNKFVDLDRTKILGESVADQFGSLPFLFKVLDVHDMLSIQVHPEKAAAERDFAAENHKGISTDSPERNYKDDNHKPELMLAQSEFWLLHGFKPQQQLERTLQTIPELNFLVPVWKQRSYEGIYRHVMEMPQEEVNSVLEPLIKRIVPLYEGGQIEKSSADFWAARAYKTFCQPGFIDRGIFSIYFFNVVRLQPGQAIFQDAGILHAYLEGQNLELMANSDNVLRGGLTNKRIDVPELLKHVKFQPIDPSPIAPSRVSAYEVKFPTPAADFELHEIKLEPGSSVTIQTTTAEIYLVMEGEAMAEDGATKIQLHRSQTLLAIAGTNLRLTSNGVPAQLFRATVPVK